ncbi:protein RALF-like 26 [Raphanus sativus]|uniref:Protein RALF-like 26 n=1 Tax=Raphanus sativus TaxID=3726 RepID=A0A6J0P387_RAPSA|nr:protein RALF-like 26 [Raphanus sativus]
MKAYLILMLVICAAAILEQTEAKPPRKYLTPHVFDPCRRHNPPAGCHPPHHGPPVPANKYSRGCSRMHRCRRVD